MNSGAEEQIDNEIKSIIIFTLESHASSSAISYFLDKHSSRVSLIVASERFGGKYGSFFQQTARNFRRSGLKFVVYIALNLLLNKYLVSLFSMIYKALGRTKKTHTLKQLQDKHNVELLFTKEVKDLNVIGRIKSHDPDLIIVLYFDHVINQEIIDIPTHGVINIHSGLLPHYRGPFPALWTVLSAERKGGVTIHYVNDQLDEGDIIFQQFVDYLPGESILNMEGRFALIGMQAIPDITHKMINKTIVKKPQGQGNYYGFPTRSDLKKLKHLDHKLYSIKQYALSFTLNLP